MDVLVSMMRAETKNQKKPREREGEWSCEKKLTECVASVSTALSEELRRE